MQRPPIGGNFEPGGLRDHMQPYLQVGGGVCVVIVPRRRGRILEVPNLFDSNLLLEPQ